MRTTCTVHLKFAHLHLGPTTAHFQCNGHYDTYFMRYPKCTACEQQQQSNGGKKQREQ